MGGNKVIGESEVKAIRSILERMAIDDEYEWCCKAVDILDELRESIAMRRSDLSPYDP